MFKAPQRERPGLASRVAGGGDDLIAVFGSKPQAIDVTTVDGQWMLKVKLASRSSGGPPTTLALPYDEAHRRLASRMGWAMPAPAARVSRTGGGFTAEGVGFGHRVGLCLGSAR